MTYLLVIINLIVIGYFSFKLIIYFRYVQPRCKNKIYYLNNKYCLKLNKETGKIELTDFMAGYNEKKEFVISQSN